MLKISGFLCLLLFSVWGCRRDAGALDAVDRRHPLMRQALAREQAGDFAGAIERYREVLMQAPRAAAAHLSLALLLHDFTQDYVAAIYHYRRYLEMRPDTQKSRLIADRLKVAEQLLAAQSVKKLAAGDTSEQARMLQQIDNLNEKVTRLEREQGEWSAERESLKREIAELRRQNRRLERWQSQLQTDGAAGAPAPIRAGDRPRTYEVRDGDSLSRIAAKVYGDETLWPRIRDANPDKVRDGEKVLTGDVLVIP